VADIDPFQWLRDDIGEIKSLIKDSEARTTQRVEKLESRVDSIERARVPMAAILAVLVFIVLKVDGLSALSNIL